MTYRHRSHKWNDLMLPEHKDRLTALRESLDREPAPEVDEQEQQAMADALQEAFQRGSPVLVRYFKEGRRREVFGRMSGLTPAMLVIGDARGLPARVPLRDLLRVEVLDGWREQC